MTVEWAILNLNDLKKAAEDNKAAPETVETLRIAANGLVALKNIVQDMWKLTESPMIDSEEVIKIFNEHLIAADQRGRD